MSPTDYARHDRIGARRRDGWRSDATGRGACSWHGGVVEWLYADDLVVHDTKTGREIGTVKWIGAYVGRELRFQGRLTDMRERDRDQFVSSCQLGR